MSWIRTEPKNPDQEMIIDGNHTLKKVGMVAPKPFKNKRKQKINSWMEGESTGQILPYERQKDNGCLGC